MKSVDKNKKKKKDPAPYYGLPSSWVDENILPDPIVTNQDLRNQNAYYLGFAKHMMKAHYRFDHKKWWQWWIKRDKFPRYPIERDQVSKD